MSPRRHTHVDVDATVDEDRIATTEPEAKAAGVKAVIVSLQRGLTQMGAVRTAATLSRLNQRHGFDCPGCAWPEEPGGRKLAQVLWLYPTSGRIVYICGLGKCG